MSQLHLVWLQSFVNSGLAYSCMQFLAAGRPGQMCVAMLLCLELSLLSFKHDGEHIVALFSRLLPLALAEILRKENSWRVKIF